MATDHRDAPDLGPERQDALVVGEQHDPFARHLQRDLCVGLGIYGAPDRRRMRVEAVVVDRVQHAPHHLAEAAAVRWVVLRSFLERLTEERRRIDRRTRLLVEARNSVVDRVDRAPIAHHKALEAPVAPQHVGEQEPAAATLRAVNGVVGAHDRFESHFPSRQG